MVQTKGLHCSLMAICIHAIIILVYPILFNQSNGWVSPNAIGWIFSKVLTAPVNVKWILLFAWSMRNEETEIAIIQAPITRLEFGIKRRRTLDFEWMMTAKKSYAVWKWDSEIALELSARAFPIQSNAAHQSYPGLGKSLPSPQIPSQGLVGWDMGFVGFVGLPGLSLKSLKYNILYL